MDSDNPHDHELMSRLRRLDASAAAATPAFDYDGLLARHARRQAGARRRQVLARGAAAAMLVVLTGASLWRLGEPSAGATMADAGAMIAPDEALPEPRIVRADTYLAVAALEDHLASLDDALNYARVSAGPADVARLERTRAELLTSYTQLRYAERVSANF